MVSVIWANPWHDDDLKSRMPLSIAVFEVITKGVDRSAQAILARASSESVH